MDDILVTTSDNDGIEELKDLFQNSFKMKDLGPLTYFLGLEIQHSSAGYLNQQKYTKDLIKLACLTDYKQVDTHMELTCRQLNIPSNDSSKHSPCSPYCESICFIPSAIAYVRYS